METYIQRCNLCIGSTTIKHEFYDNSQSLLFLIHHYKNLLIDFVTRYLFSINQKKDSYDAILNIINRLTNVVD